MPTVAVTPATAPPSSTVDVTATGWSPKSKASIQTVDAKGAISPASPTPSVRPMRDGSFAIGCNVPSALGAAKIRVKQGTTTVDAPVTVATTPVPAGPRITAGPTVSGISTTGATVAWSLDQPCTGQIEYGPAGGYGSKGPLEASFDYSSHQQVLAGLTPGTAYNLRVVGKNAAGVSYTSPPVQFTTAAVVPPPVEPPPVEPPPVEPPPTTGMYRPIYGTGISADSKDNREVGKVGQQVAHRLIESSDKPVTSLALNWRGGSSGYGAGDGGTIRISKQTDNGGVPSGLNIGTPVTVRPGLGASAGESKVQMPIPGWPSVKGRVVHYVFENVAPDAANNWLSINETTVLDGSVSSPAYTADYAVLSRIVPPLGNNVWKVVNNLPVMDVTYADGSHDGNGYFQMTYVGDLSTSGIIDGKGAARQAFKPAAAITVVSLAIRLKRTQGSGALTLTLDGAGRSVALDGTSIPLSPYPVEQSGGAHWDEASLAGNRWVKGAIPATVLAAGQQYYLRATCPAGTIYLISPLREVGAIDQQGTVWGSRVFKDGSAQLTRDGSAWRDAYPTPHDWPFYLDLA